jgi:hypothetical protein
MRRQAVAQTGCAGPVIIRIDTDVADQGVELDVVVPVITEINGAIPTGVLR